jgi:hypothetical protein
MPSAPYTLSTQPTKPSWLDRHAGWKIPLGCLLAIGLLAAFVALIFTVVTSAFRNSDVYKEAIVRAEQSRQVTDRIGTPLRPGWLAQGKIEVSGSSGSARMEIPVMGPRGKATINLDANKVSGVWQFRMLEAQFEDSSSVNLLAVENGARDR